MRLSILILFTILFTLLLAPLGSTRAQDLPPVQELSGSLAPGQVDVFRIAGIKKGQTLDAFMENRSGNLDPILFILAADENLPATLESYQKAVTELAASSTQPLFELPALKGSIRPGLG